MEASMPHSALKHPPDFSAEPAGYEDDFVLWIGQQVELLRLGKLDELDVENLIEELDDMGRSQRIKLSNRLEVLIMHLLKCEYQPEHKSGSWLGTLREQRSRISKIIKTSPSLAKKVEESANDTFEAAKDRAAIETGLPTSAFPAANPYSKEQLLDKDFVPCIRRGA
jgi:predicted DNA-binding ribbon-helix-helix protein